MSKQWSIDRIWDWYNSRPWMRGCNYMSADCANFTDLWQSHGFEERLKTTDEELALAKETGFNTIRVLLQYVVWKEDHEGFYDRVDRYLDVCAKHGMSCMVMLANDCMPPKSPQWKLPYLGEQSYDWGYHGGRKSSQHGLFSGVAPHYYLDDPETAEDYFKMVREFVTHYRDDPRICIWDVYNEPGNSNRVSVTLPNVKRMFETVREVNPSQPLTSAAWHANDMMKGQLNEVETYAVEHSDIVSYHCYTPYVDHVKIIRQMKKYGRPLLNTEWLCRGHRNNVAENFPLMYLEKIGCWNWGFVAGKSQTYEPYNAMWSILERDPHYVEEFDFTRWFHDLYRPSHHPYDPQEIKLIKEYCAMADEDWNSK